MFDILTARLRLEPLTLAHAEPMFRILSEPSLYSFLDSSPPESVELLQQRCARLESGASPDGSQRWINWLVVVPGEGPIGFVQATVIGGTAWVAYLLSRAQWSRGYATEATSAMLSDLASAHGVSRFRATVEVANSRSIALLRGLGFRLADSGDAEGLRLSPTERLYIRDAGSGRHDIQPAER